MDLFTEGFKLLIQLFIGYLFFIFTFLLSQITLLFLGYIPAIMLVVLIMGSAVYLGGYLAKRKENAKK